MILRGVLPINKPKGLSSYDCIRKIKIVFPNTKLGHAGTLDPLASGLLLILFNEANKIAQYLMNQDKEYVAVIELGKQTDTDDISGQVISQRPYSSISQNKVAEILQGFLGKQTQIPPKFSALKQNGQRSYILARQGFDFTPKARRIEIKEIELLDFNLPFITVRTSVSKGTYIRALARDIGEHLGCGGTLADLKRTKIGRFELNKAIDLSAIQAKTIKPYLQTINEVLTEIPSITVNEKDLKKLLTGQSLKWNQNSQITAALVRVIDEKNRALILAKYHDDKIYPERVIYADL